MSEPLEVRSHVLYRLFEDAKRLSEARRALSGHWRPVRGLDSRLDDKR